MHTQTTIPASPAPATQPQRPKALGDLLGGHVVESRTPLPESVLWTIQRSFYDERGASAWAGGAVPHYITCNPSIAQGYAETILGFARDCRAAGALPTGGVLRVLELGGGSGRFAALLLAALRDAVAGSSLADVQVRYILTDFSQARLDHWSDHPGLADARRAGWLRVAQLDAADPTASPAAADEIGLDPGEAPGPVVVVANYVLDSLPQECLALRERTPHWGLLTTMAPRPLAGAPGPADLADLQFAWDFPAPDSGRAADPVTDPDLSAVVAEYADTLDDTVLLVPVAAVACLRALCRDRSTPTLALVADKGTTSRRDLLGLGPPGLALHDGCFSLMVNFDALAGVVTRWGGLPLHPEDRAANLVVAGYALPAGQVADWPETALAYRLRLGSAGPDDWFVLQGAIATGGTEVGVEQALALLRLSRWDPVVLQRLFPRLLEIAGDTPEQVRPDLVRALRRVWSAYVPIGESTDVALLIGLLLNGVGRPREALDFFDRSVAEHGPSANARFGAALAHTDLGEAAAARRSAAAAAELDPSFGAARALLVSLAEDPE